MRRRWVVVVIVASTFGGFRSSRLTLGMKRAMVESGESRQRLHEEENLTRGRICCELRCTGAELRRRNWSMERRQESRISKLREESRRRPRQRGGVRRRRGPSPKSLAILPQRLKACNNILSRSMSSIYRRVIFGAVDMLSIHLFCYYSLNDTVFSHTVCIICSSFSTAPRTTLLSKSIRKWGGGLLQPSWPCVYNPCFCCFLQFSVLEAKKP